MASIASSMVSAVGFSSVHHLPARQKPTAMAIPAGRHLSTRSDVILDVGCLVRGTNPLWLKGK
jgi:hypothetical protein